ncbi:Phragmoplast orienting kinesin-1 [Spatholobus suberectus]|nr:Phragmoplast orienting kinesin-1 [Spatholobus suberectus]
MSKEPRISARKNPQSETNENELEPWQNPINFPPPRTPLNSIPDPSQCQEPEPVRPARFGNATPRFSGRFGKAHSEPNSAQSTPSRNTSRVSLGGGRGVSSCTLLKETEFCVQVPHFELKDDPSFWMDHNVQVLIRIRPLSNTEKLSQGHGRCLKQESAQTLVWLGHPETRFTFDHIGCETLSQENLFRVAGVPMVENCLSGYNSCMFAYGQTGSGKTYTMMGEIKETDGYLTEDSGITPRVFDYLFTRIKVEEESRKDYKLKYSCKCSFLEIYNEQITDLLEPSSTNLQLREDLKKGVYVENLTEHSVVTVYDVLRLLLQGTANRKVAATHMNCESSRSHSVFTCIIESQWEKDSMTHFRFARLNLVDLAGSERQKSSGADSERLKEAANINKSLSTLGLVIMTLVDLAHGKPRHVPYRDSRLTFLLQDSLGGNSKTMIIANVSPSICCANETLSTLKFAQRAKLIQNNAKVNEDASGDVNALQWQIQQLKGQLSFLMNNKIFPTSLSNLEPNSESCRLSEVSEEYDSLGERVTTGHKLLIPSKEIKCMKAALVSALRREKMAETTIQNLKAEIDHTNCLVRQREEDIQHTSNMLRHYKEKIKQLELLVEGKLSAEKYLMEENRALQEEIQLLKVNIDKNSESSRLALENDRLLQQLQLFQNFYEHGERERLLTELSELRDQLLVHLQGKFTFSMKNENQDMDTAQELEECQNMNSKLLREVGKLQAELGKYLNYNQVLNSSFEHPDGVLKTDKCSLVETISMRSDSGDEIPSSSWEADDALANIIEGNALGASVMPAKDNEYNNNKELEAKLEKMSQDLEEARLLNSQYQEKWALRLSQKLQIETVCQEVEMETTSTILHLQEEVAHLQSEFEERLCTITQENAELRNLIAEKEEEIRSRCLDWEKAILELTTFLLEGSRSLKDACGQVKSISCSFPQVNACISKHVDMAVKKYIEKEETIQQLQSSLEDAQKMVLDMELKISSLKEATVTFNAFQQLDNNEGIEEVIQLRVLLNEKTNMIRMLENEINHKNNQLCKVTKQADAALLVAKWLSDCYNVAHRNGDVQDISIPELHVQARLGSCTISENQDVGNNLILNDLMAQVELTKLEVLEMENAVKASFVYTETQTEVFRTGVSGLYSAYRDLIQDMVKETRDMRKEIRVLKMYHRSSEGYTVDSLTSNANKCQEFANQHHTLHQIKEQLVEVNRRLNIIENFISTEADVSSFQPDG